MATITVHADRLTLTADYEEITAIRSQYVSEMTGLYMLLECWLCSGWTLCEADELGALSEAPILSQDISISDAGEYEVTGPVYYYEPYQVRSVLDDIARDGVAVFLRASE